MEYDSAVRYLLSLGRELDAPTQAAAAKFNLENITTLLERMGRPDRSFPSVHIAGTNGKGSTAAFVEAILRNAGFRTGLNTSPHLERINERIRIDGVDIADDEFAEIFTRVHDLIEELLADGRLRVHPSYFECVTAIAFEAFARARVDFAVIEVGLGGRLDATNVISPTVTAITRIDFDHENFLGHSLREIAGEKAGILKYQVPLVLGEQQAEAKAVIIERAGELKCPALETAAAYTISDETFEDGLLRAVVTDATTQRAYHIAPQLPGRFQLQNAMNALGVARVLQDRGYRIHDEHIERGIAEARWPGRLERLQSRPDIYLDGAHNPGAARELARFLDEQFAGRRIYMLFAAMRDKAVDEVTGILFPRAYEVLFTEPRNSRAISAAQLAEIAGHHAAKYSIHRDAEEALDAALAKASPNDAIFITGSLYLVGQMRHAWRERGKVASS
jgi:dihydrofolate synthase/folylpolyglutamate synthase